MFSFENVPDIETVSSASVMKASRSYRPSSKTIYKGTVLIPYVNGMSEKFRGEVRREV
jgi:hypothetical protein